MMEFMEFTFQNWKHYFGMLILIWTTFGVTGMTLAMILEAVRGKK